jgi:maltose alpha-D-glucosyltransferase / alpha-amylase
LMNEYLAFVDRLAARVAQLHRLLASDPNDPAFASEPFTALARRSMYQRIRSRIVSLLDLLHRSSDTLPEASASAVAALLERRDSLLGEVASLLAAPDGGRRIRCHGNLHLGQVLHAGDDLVIVDFDGEPGRPVFERRLKRSPLQDVVSLMRSFGYAATEGLNRFAASHEAADASTWAMLWRYEAAVRFLAEYRRAMAGSDLLPDHAQSWRAFLLAAWIERTVHELAVEIEEQRGWLDLPLADLVDVVQPSSGSLVQSDGRRNRR